MSQTARSLKENDQGLFLATRGSQVKEAFERGQIAVFFQFQSAEPVISDLGMLDVYYELGLRILQLTYHHENIFGGGCLVKDSEWTGLTPLGFGAVEKMNALGIIPDLSHGNENVGLDVLKTSKKPVIISHTGCRAIVNNARCAPDSLIKGVADSGGVVGIFAMSFWLTNDPLPTVDHAQASLLTGRLQADPYPPIVGRELYCVREQVFHDLPEALSVSRRPAGLQLQESLDPDPPRVGLLLGLDCGRLDHSTKGYRHPLF